MTRVRSRSAVMALSVRGWVGGCGALLLAGCSSNCLRDSDCGDGYVCHRDACWLVVSDSDAGVSAGAAGQAGASQLESSGSGGGGAGGGGAGGSSAVGGSGGVGGSAIVTDAGAGGSATEGRENLDASGG